MKQVKNKKGNMILIVLMSISIVAIGYSLTYQINSVFQGAKRKSNQIFSIYTNTSINNICSTQVVNILDDYHVTSNTNPFVGDSLYVQMVDELKYSFVNYEGKLNRLTGRDLIQSYAIDEVAIVEKLAEFINNEMNICDVMITEFLVLDNSNKENEVDYKDSDKIYIKPISLEVVSGAKVSQVRSGYRLSGCYLDIFVKDNIVSMSINTQEMILEEMYYLCE